jgi:hypothetical protein
MGELMEIRKSRVHHKFTMGVWLLSVFLLAVPAMAQEHPAAETGEHGTEAEAHEHGEGAEHHGYGYHPNHIALFFGVTDEEGHDLEFTLGFDYERRLSQRWGVGVMIDHAGGGLRNSVLGVPVFWHPGGKWKLWAAPGVEYHNGRGQVVEGHGEHGEIDEDETYFLVRLGVGYDIPLGGSWGLTPNLNVDFVEGERVWVYGVAFTFGW